MTNLEKWKADLTLEQCIRIISDMADEGCEYCPVEPKCRNATYKECIKNMEAWAKKEAAQ